MRPTCIRHEIRTFGLIAVTFIKNS